MDYLEAVVVIVNYYSLSLYSYYYSQALEMVADVAVDVAAEDKKQSKT